MFAFLKFLQPSHYFSLRRTQGDYVFPEIASLPDAILQQLEEDTNYNTKTAQNYDLSWQALHKGYIGDTKTIQDFDTVPIYDEYVFIRKYFSSVWVFYVLILRLLSFNNPIKEFDSWIKTRNIERSLYLKTPIYTPGWETYHSELIAQNPIVSVVIPTLNRYPYLRTVLEDFEQQDYSNFEIIVVDQSEPFNESFYAGFNLNLLVVRQQEKALWLARNTAIKQAKGSIIAFSEDDVRVNADWLSSHLKCLDFFKADISAGVFYPEGQQLPHERSFFVIASQFATGNAMLYKSVFNEVGLFDRQFEKQRMGDGEFGLRTYLKGFKCISNPRASCVDVKAESGGLREMGSWDAFRTSKLFAPRPIPSVLYFFRRYFGDAQARWSLLRTVPMSIMPYRLKKNKVLTVVGVLVSVLLLPLVILQVLKSWHLSSKKLEQGPLIERLN